VWLEETRVLELQGRGEEDLGREEERKWEMGNGERE
jgi:hypothetical protein